MTNPRPRRVILVRPLLQGQVKRMIGRDAKERVMRATIRLPALGGCGVLVPGNIIVTAAHCIEWSEGMALDDGIIQPVETARGNFNAAIVALEHIRDIAAIGEPDNQKFSDDAERFNAFCADVEPLPLFTSTLARERPLPIYIYTHRGAWLTGTATYYGGTESAICIESEIIESGTSGSAIVTEAGEVVGIVSNSGGCEGDTRAAGLTPRPHLALPNWLVRQISNDR